MSSRAPAGGLQHKTAHPATPNSAMAEQSDAPLTSHASPVRPAQSAIKPTRLAVPKPLYSQVRDALLTRIRGLVTQKVVARVALPVLIANLEARPLHRVLVCDSGAQSPSLLQLFRARLPELLATMTDVTVLHVMSQISAAPGVKGEDLQATAEQLIQSHTPEGALLGQDLAYLDALNLHTRAIVRHGLVVDEIAAEARSDAYDLVVIGAHRDEGLSRFLLDDLAHELVLDVERAILVVR